MILLFNLIELSRDMKTELKWIVKSCNVRLERSLKEFRPRRKMLMLSLMLNVSSAKNLRENYKKKSLMLKEKRLF